jgi:hypothetical protein
VRSKPRLTRSSFKLEEGATRSDLEELNHQNNASAERDLPRSQVDVVDLPRDLPVDEAVERYEADPNVAFAEPDFVLRPSQTTSSNGFYYPRLYGLNNTGQNGGTRDADVNGWDFYNRDSSVYDPIPSRAWAMSMVPTSPVR